jgi:putative acetyltransferase
MQSEIPALRDAARRLVREFGFLQERHGPTGLPYAQTHILLEVERRPLIGVGDLAELLNLELSGASRHVSRLVKDGLLKVRSDAKDGRRKPLAVTPAGTAILKRLHTSATDQVAAALSLMRPEERAVVTSGLVSYSRALEHVRRQRGIEIRQIRRSDNEAIAAIIVSVMSSFGAVGEGYSIEDAEVRSMYEAYRGPRSRYYVVDRGGTVIGGGGVAQLSGGRPNTCELKKMYFLPEARGIGLGKRMLQQCLSAARDLKYTRVYLETLEHMGDAIQLYEGFGFERLPRPMGNTGHFRTDRWYLLKL